MSTANYLGEETHDLSTDPVYGKYTPSDWALYWIMRYGGFDGAHHKDWVLDQVARILNGAPITAKVARWSDHPPEYRFKVGTSDEYDKWVISCKGDFCPESGEYEYDYSVGIPP